MKEEGNILHKIGGNTWTCKSSSGYDFGDIVPGGPYLEVEISCERPEKRWMKLHDQLHSFIETCVRELVDDINAFIDLQRPHYTKSEKWRPAGARRKLSVITRDGEKCTFEVTITLTVVDIPNKARAGICQGIADAAEKKFVPAHYII